MAGSLWSWGIDYQHQPLLDAWWTPGWTSQNDSYIQVPPSAFGSPGFPQGLNYVTVLGNYFDTSSNPLSGYLTFWPSTPLTFLVNGTTTYMPQRYAGINQTSIGVNQMSTSSIYLWYGQLNVSLLATDNLNMTPVSFTYHVREHYPRGQQYDIIVPGSDFSNPPDIHSLIIPGSIRPINDDEGNEEEQDESCISIPVTSSQYIVADVSTLVAGSSVYNPTSFPVNLAFIAGPTQPQMTDWIPAQWSSGNLPYVAQLMIGPIGHVLPLGTYKVWAQIVTNTQIPVIPVGYVTIY